jgi:AcrR family transcriptional regulator
VPARGRRPLGSPDARQAVLDAARELFAELGFERTTMRAVATRAGVDPALIYHYFGDKDGLLFATLQPPADAATVFAGLAATTADRTGADQTGEELVRRLIGLWEERPEVREQMAAILRTGLSHDRAAGLLRDILSSFILAALGDVLADDRRELRTALIGSHIGGLMLARYILKVPGAAAASPEDLVQAVGPVVQHYLTGTIAARPGSAPASVEDPGYTELLVPPGVPDPPQRPDPPR